MSAQGLEVIDHTVQLTHEWINELSERLGWASKRSALRLMRTVFHQIRDRLSTDELAQFSAQLPLLLRGMLFEGWVPTRSKVAARRLEDFAAEIAGKMGDDAEYRGVEDTRYVFELLNNRIGRGEVDDIRACLSEHLRGLWPKP
jgi:uncharacterized protein (DUF2267 family)